MYSDNDYRYYLDQSLMESDDFLAHYGVKGMKWKDHQYVIDPRLRERMARGLGTGGFRINSNPMFKRNPISGVRSRVNAARRKAKFRRAINSSPVGNMRRDLKRLDRRLKRGAIKTGIKLKAAEGAYRLSQTKGGQKVVGKLKDAARSEKGKKLLKNYAKYRLGKAALKTGLKIATSKPVRKMVGNEIKKSVNSGVNSAKQRANSTYNSARSKANQAYNSARSKANATYNSARSKANQAYNSARNSEAARRAKQGATNAYNTVKNSKAVKTAKTTANKAYNTAKTKANQAYNSARKTANKAYNSAKFETTKASREISSRARATKAKTKKAVKKYAGEVRRRVNNTNYNRMRNTGISTINRKRSNNR